MPHIGNGTVFKFVISGSNELLKLNSDKYLIKG